MTSEIHSRISQAEILERTFPRVNLVVPRSEVDDPVPAAAPATQRRGRLAAPPEGRRARKSSHEVFERFGMCRIEHVHLKRQQTGRTGVYAPLSALGMTAAFFGSDKDEADAHNELADEYDFIPNFALGLPGRVREPKAFSTPPGTPSPTLQWPPESGIDRAHEIDIRGRGVLVGVLDTGIDADHAEFVSRIVPFRYVSLFPDSPYWPPRDVRGFDMDGHGTHVCGIIAGENVGVAPEANLYVASVIESETTRSSLIRVTYGLDWILRHFSSPENESRPAVLSMSLGFPPTATGDISRAEYDRRLRLISVLLKTLVESDVLPVVAIGNDGRGNYSYPGASREVIGVGAANFNQRIARFSGSGRPPGERVDKPDIIGYGVDVYSGTERSYDGASIYERFSGTSMATPYVAGIAALYRCQDRGASVADTIDRLTATAIPLTPKRRAGAGLARFVE